MRRIFLNGSIILLVLSSCKTATTELTNLHRDKYTVKTLDLNDSQKLIDIDVAIIPLPKVELPKAEKEKTFFDLRDSIPHKYLEVLGGKVSSPEDLIKFLKEPLSNKPIVKPASLPTDYSKIHVRMLIANTKKYYELASENSQQEFLHPNTRLEFLNTEIGFDTSNFKIVSIDRLQNEFEVIDLGTLERSNQVQFNSKLTAQYGVNAVAKNTTGGANQNSLNSESVNTRNIYDEKGNLVGSMTISGTSLGNQNITEENTLGAEANMGLMGEIGFTDNESIKEALNLKLKKLKTGFSFNSKKIKLAQRGSNLLDISDNIVLTATLEAENTETKTVFSFNELFKNNDGITINPAKDIIINSRKIKFIPFKNSGPKENSFTMQLKAEGVIRTVRNNRKSRNNLEYDDLVNYYKFSLNTSNVVEVDFLPFTKKIYSIEGVADGKRMELIIENPVRESVFLLDEEKLELYKWLKWVIKNPEMVSLENNSFELYFGDSDSKMKYKVVSLNMSSQDIERLKEINISFKEIEEDKRPEPPK